jgi:PBP1b-binding outer membrane lipoprotein LpoB
MRYITIILCAMLLGSCSKLNGLKTAGEKMKQTVNVCTQTIDAACTDVKCPSVSTDKHQAKEGIDTKSLINWNTQMMLW